MAEYIEKKAAIKELMSDAPGQVGYSREDAADCIRYMDAVEVVTVQEWISADDRLPENIANRVLVVCERSNGVFYAHYEKPFWINLETDKPFISAVTHWMPLPEPPKGE